MLTEKLMIYRDFAECEVLENMSYIIKNYKSEKVENRLYSCLNQIIEIADSHGFDGNLWQIYLTYLLTKSENVYSKACEIQGEVKGSVNQIAMHDFALIKEYFDFDFAEIEKTLQVPFVKIIENYENVKSTRKIFNSRIRNRICDLAVDLSKAETVEEFKAKVTLFYKDFGVGKFGLHKAFRIENKNEETKIVPITNIAHVHLDDLVGYETPKKKLVANTKAFVEGKKANNCLLFGDAGTGKSSCVKAILNEYYDKGLRMIEVYKHQFQNLNDVISQIKNRNYKFIIYMDDLSFEEFEIEYKYLKAVIEGGLEKKPENVLIYATSNRRHLVREEFADKLGIREDLHASDTVQEKLSLSARFGESIFFNGPSKKEFNQIVKVLAEKSGIDMPEDELLLEANKWELSHGGKSGRTARQFIDHLMGTR